MGSTEHAKSKRVCSAVGHSQCLASPQPICQAYVRVASDVEQSLAHALPFAQWPPPPPLISGFVLTLPGPFCLPASLRNTPPHPNALHPLHTECFYVSAHMLFPPHPLHNRPWSTRPLTDVRVHVPLCSTPMARPWSTRPLKDVRVHAPLCSAPMARPWSTRPLKDVRVHAPLCSTPMARQWSKRAPGARPPPLPS